MKRIYTLKDLITRDSKPKDIPPSFFFLRSGNKVLIGKDLEGLEIIKIDQNVFVVKYISEEKYLYQFVRYDEGLPLIVDNVIAPAVSEVTKKLSHLFSLLNSGDVERAKKELLSLKGMLFIEDSQSL